MLCTRIIATGRRLWWRVVVRVNPFDCAWALAEETGGDDGHA